MSASFEDPEIYPGFNLFSFLDSDCTFGVIGLNLLFLVLYPCVLVATYNPVSSSDSYSSEEFPVDVYSSR